VAQVGRISGPLLQADLLRNGIDLAFETDLVYLDVSAGRVGIRTNSPTNELQSQNEIRTTNLIVDTQADFTNIINIQNSDIQPFPGSLFLDARYNITANRVKTDNLLLDDDRISTYTTDTNIELRPNGTGRTEFENLWVENNFNITGDVRLDGNITFGNQDTDSVTFDADITSDIIPDADITYNLGTAAKRWQTIESRLLNGQDMNAQVALIGGVDIGTRPGNTFYVSVNGDNSNVGDHPQGPYRTIDYAVTQASAGDTIYVFPGEYEETCPITIPTGVSIVGTDMRNTVIRPVSSDNYVDIFLLNDQTYVSHLTIKDFYYDSINNVGHAFRFANDTTITTRPPYIENVTVITRGSVTSASDPLGFEQGDAGKGALVDGADVLSTTTEASMLFYSTTFITPGVDALTMTNGVRVEWLDSFTYFANRGFYAVDGATGLLSPDGSTIKYGASIRSINSANVYGNYGAVADGVDTLMYLIMHNMAYIGSGKFSDNDPSRVIQANEAVKLNSGKIYYQTVNHLGDFRIGENFFINAETGESSIVITEGEVQGFGRLRVTSTDTGNVTIVDGEEISTGNLLFTGNEISSVLGDVNIASNGVINLLDSVNITGDLAISGDLTFDGSLNLLGNQTTDTLTFNVNIEQDLNPNTTLTFDLGSPSKTWNNVWLSEAQIGDLQIQDNYITTDISNADLELRANGTGEILIPSNNVQIDNNLTVSTDTDLQSTTITGLLDQTGDRTQTGNFTLNGEWTVDNVYLEDNFISTTTGNLTLSAPTGGAGLETVEFAVGVDGSFSEPGMVGGIYLGWQGSDANGYAIVDQIASLISVGEELSLYLNGGLVTTGNITDINYDPGNFISIATDTGWAAWESVRPFPGAFVGDIITFEAPGVVAAREVQVDANNVELAQDLTVSGATDLQSVSITGLLDQTGDRNQTGDYSVTNLTLTGDLTVGSQVQLEEILFDGNVITTTTTNTDLELRASGTGEILVPNDNVQVDNNFEVQGTTFTRDINNSVTVEAVTLTTGDVNITSNVIDTSTSNSNLELRANGTGLLYVPTDDVQIDNNLTVSGDTDLQSTNVTGTITHVGDTTQTGDYTQTGNLEVSGNATFDRAAQFEDVRIDGNLVATTLTNSDLDLRASGTGVVRIANSTVFSNNMSAANIVVGDINIDNDLVLDELTITDSNVTINDNYITTETSNASLELRANGIGEILIPLNDAVLEQDLTVNSNTDLDNLNVTGTISQTGNKTQTGNINNIGDITIDGKFTIADQPFQFEDILIDGNVLTTTLSNSNLDLRANGSSNILLNDSAAFRQNTTVRNMSVSDIVTTDSVSLEEMISSSNIKIFDNVIATTILNSDLELSANGTGIVYVEQIGVEQDVMSTNSTDITFDVANPVIESTGSLQIPTGTTQQRTTRTTGNIRYNSTLGLFEGVSQTEQYFNGVYSQDSLTNMYASTNNTIEINVEGTKVGEVNESTFSIHGMQIDDVNINNNRISTNVSNSDLELRTSGTGVLRNGSLELTGNQFINNKTESGLVLGATANGYIKFTGTGAIVIPNGTTAERTSARVPELGETRWNTDNVVMETWDGNQWILSAGNLDVITEQEYNDLLLEYTLIFG